jgi:hypothetical protein
MATATVMLGLHLRYIGIIQMGFMPGLRPDVVAWVGASEQAMKRDARFVYPKNHRAWEYPAD